MKLKKLALDNMNSGVTVDLGEGSSVTLRSTNSKKYQDYIQQRLKPYRQSIKSKSIGDEALGKIYEEIMLDALADVVVTGWEGIKDENDVAVEYSKENVLKIVKDPAYAEFKDMLQGLASENETFRQATVDSVVGN